MRFPLPKHHGVLGINARNFNYLKPFNPEKAMAFADDKLKTKIFLETRGIPVPKLYAKITSRDELRAFDFSSLPDSSALKPNFGYGGEGILILHERVSAGWRTASGRITTDEEVLEHIENILDGMYSLNHRRDLAFFERLITPSDAFAPLNPAGLPDIRIIVFNLVPVMAMMRLPTEESEGKANVHLGGIGLGIDIAKGMTTFGVQRNALISTLPNGREIAGFKVPYWEEMLLIASRIQQMTNIGFVGVDLTIDKDVGPILLEVNARAGLMVQIANLAPLGKRLDRVAGIKVGSPEKGVRIAQDLFGEKVVKKEEGKKHDEKPVLSTHEVIEILGGKKQLLVTAVLRPDYDRTVFDPSLIRELSELKAVEQLPDGTHRVKFALGGKKIQTVIHSLVIRDDDAEIRASIGRRDLAGFLVDPAKKHMAPIHVATDLKRIDAQLADIDRKIQLLRYVRPENLESERAKAEQDAAYNPVFIYAPPSFDPKELRDRLQYLEADRSPLGQLLEKKRKEILLKLSLLEARGNNDEFCRVSIELFGEPNSENLKEAKAMIQAWQKPSDDSSSAEVLSAEEVQSLFEGALRSYGLRDWSVKLKAGAIADVTIGKKSLLIRSGAHCTRERITSLIAHEIETHVLTSENGAMQPYELFERGMAGYLETQEGLAVYNQNAVLPEHHEKRLWPAMNLLAVHYGATHSFAQLRSSIRTLGFDDDRALRTCLKVKRGMGDTALHGAFTKDIVYFCGYKLVREYLAHGGDAKVLYQGKVNLNDLPLLLALKDLIAPVYLPRRS
ncbi:MAG TPA: tyrosine/phenylalanine carboxypeptidase domain-containing protein [Candidatus Peribacterales bacterium]|nr:tyrosine/phenylalanine carboxypeptidase domain-containing protein [Candidatus Peribacterales bacterium]